jgi:hypothetical protein
MKDYQSLLEETLYEIAQQNIADGYDEISAWDFCGSEMLQILRDLGCPDDEAR